MLEGSYRPAPGSERSDALNAAFRAEALKTNRAKPKNDVNPEKTFSEEEMTDASFNANLDALMDAKLKKFKANKPLADDMRKATWEMKVRDALIASEIEETIAAGIELTPEAVQRIKDDVARRMAEEGEIVHGSDQYNAENYKAA